MGPVSPWRPKAARRRQRLRAREGQRGSAWRRSGSLHQSRRCWSTCKARYLSLRLRHCLAIRSKAHRMVVFTTSGQAHPAATRMASRLHITCSACSSTPSPTSFMVCDASGRHPGEQRCVGEQSSPVGEGRWSQRHRASPCTSPPVQKGGESRHRASARTPRRDVRAPASRGPRLQAPCRCALPPSALQRLQGAKKGEARSPGCACAVRATRLRRPWLRREAGDAAASCCAPRRGAGREAALERRAASYGRRGLYDHCATVRL